MTVQMRSDPVEKVEDDIDTYLRDVCLVRDRNCCRPPRPGQIMCATRRSDATSIARKRAGSLLRLALASRLPHGTLPHPSGYKGPLMRTLLASAVAVALLAIAPAFAADQVMDLSTIECHQFTAYNKDNTALIMTWLEAYYLGDNDPPVLNFTKMASDTKSLLEFCTANPTVGLITAADKTMGKDKSK